MGDRYPDPTELDDETPVAVTYVGVRSPEGSYSTLETEVVENGLTSDRPDVVELAEYHSANDRYPRRRLVVPTPENDVDEMVVEARRSCEDGTRWATYARPGTVSVRVAPREPADAEPAVRPAAAD